MNTTSSTSPTPVSAVVTKLETPSEFTKFIDRLLANSLLQLIPRSVSPNMVTTFRLVSIPVVLWLLYTAQYPWALGLFVVSVFTDAIDGAMARTRDQITAFGKLYDPLADKLLIGSTALFLVAHFLSLWLAATIVVLEILLILNAVVYLRWIKGVVVSADRTGKIKMILQSIGIFLLFVYTVLPLPILLVAAAWLLYAAVVFAAFSLTVYGSV